MNELRKWISDELIDHAKNYERAFDSDRVERTHEATDRILALIAEAMLSNDVVDAGERVLIRDEWAKANRAKSFNVIETALQAAGITPGDAQEGGEGE